jgi:MFS family permease
LTRADTSVVVDGNEVAAWLAPRDRIVLEREVSPGVYEAAEGPVADYRRTVTVEPTEDGRCRVTQVTDFRLDVPFAGWLFLLPLKSALKAPPGRKTPWWAPPERLDARAASILGVLAAAAVVSGYLGTLITQTITFAGDDLGGASDRAKGVALASVRPGIFIALGLLAIADRRGRRLVLVGSAAGGCVLAATGALAPSLFWLAASQLVARVCSTALGELITIVAAEEMPRGARAYAFSLLGMSAAFGAGICVMALPLADTADWGWRLLYVIPLLGLPLCWSIAKRLPESRRFTVRHRNVPLAGHGGRLALLAGSAFLLAIFTTPASQLQNEFLRDERGYTAFGITLFVVLTNTPAGIGVVVGGRLADLRGRRGVAAVAMGGGVAFVILQYLSEGGLMWLFSLVGAIIAGAALPAFTVYGPELFPTSLRGRANGIIRLLAVVGAGVGLLAAGVLVDELGGLARALMVLAIGPAIVVALVLTRYPETAHRELEELNPEDPPLPATP